MIYCNFHFTTREVPAVIQYCSFSVKSISLISFFRDINFMIFFHHYSSAIDIRNLQIGSFIKMECYHAIPTYFSTQCGKIQTKSLVFSNMRVKK